jgi:hypothetical protein
VYCTELIPLKCPRGHDNKKQCSRPPIARCAKCDQQDKLAEAKRQKELARKQKCEQEEADHLLRKKELEEQLEEERQKAKEDRLREERENEIRMKEADPEDMRKGNKQTTRPRPTTYDPSSLFRGSTGSTGGRSTTQPPSGGGGGNSNTSSVANPPDDDDDEGRDPGVSDAVWAELLAAKAANEAEEKRIQAEVDEADRLAREAYDKEVAEHARFEKLKRQESEERDRVRQGELKKQRELQQLRDLWTQRRRKQLEAGAKARHNAQENAWKRELEAQKRLRQMGVCVAGFLFHRVGDGWRCDGGTHYMTDAQLGFY